MCVQFSDKGLQALSPTPHPYKMLVDQLHRYLGSEWALEIVKAFHEQKFLDLMSEDFMSLLHVGFFF